MSSLVSFNQVAQLVKKFEKVGWDAARITALGQADAKKFRSIEAILDGATLEATLQAIAGCVGNDTTHLRFLKSAVIAPTLGSATLAQANEIFTGYIDPNYYNWGTNNPGMDRAETTVDIYEVKKNGTYADLFGSFGVDPCSLCLSQGQIKEFSRTHRNLLRQDGYATFFLFEVNGELFVAYVYLGAGRLEACVRRFSLVSSVWRAAHCPRVVVPQQTT